MYHAHAIFFKLKKSTTKEMHHAHAIFFKFKKKECTTKEMHPMHMHESCLLLMPILFLKRIEEKGIQKRRRMEEKGKRKT